MHTDAKASVCHDVFLDREEVLRTHRRYWFFRRAQDLVLASIALIVLSPVVLSLIALILIDSPGASPIFSQVRVGRDGKKFVFYN